MIDEFTWFSARAIKNSKAVASKVFMQHWIAIFGAPRKTFSENGGEFTGDPFTNMCEKFKRFKLLHLKIHGVTDYVNVIIKH